MRMSGKTAIVTGAASGIGREIARVFAREGAKVCIADLNRAGAEDAAAQIGREGGTAISLAMDASNEAQVEQAVAEAAERLGGIDVAVSNAGIQHIAAVVDLSFEAWRKLLAIHLDGAFLLTRAAMRRMIEQKRGGVLLYMGSVHSKEASPLKAPYVAAKHGVLGLARVVAKEGAAHGIRSNVICPGFVRTPLVDKQIPEQARDLGITEEQVVKNVMLKATVDGEFTTVGDVAELALFLAAFPTNALTGQSITVSHGWHMA
ncbi:MAG TPA: 3-hydroxybutyrate dehydrogenase [Myxococcales bacterium]|nr:3-hydroxybutyrate dehydrogenase [Myxococcales bacterium]